jgi:hypothetical protein
MPRGVDFRIPLAAVRQASAEHQAGWSLRALARMRYAEWGYASPGSALEGLRHAMRELDMPVRDRIEATVDASTIHGNARRAMRAPEHPEHARNLAHRRHLRQRKGDAAAS